MKIFCVKKIKCSNMLEMLKNTFGKSVIKKQVYIKGINVLKRDMKPLKMTR